MAPTHLAAAFALSGCLTATEWVLNGTVRDTSCAVLGCMHECSIESNECMARLMVEPSVVSFLVCRHDDVSLRSIANLLRASFLKHPLFQGFPVHCHSRAYSSRALSAI
jgi:hypothetical protein